MIELEVYARGLRVESTLMALHSQMDHFPQVRYKVDTHHDLVYLEIDEPERVSLKQLNNAFTTIGLLPRIVGQVPEGFAEEHDTTRVQ